METAWGCLGDEGGGHGFLGMPWGEEGDTDTLGMEEGTMTPWGHPRAEREGHGFLGTP